MLDVHILSVISKHISSTNGWNFFKYLGNDPWMLLGAQWLSGRGLDSRPKGRWFKPHRRQCVVSLSKNINPSLVLVQPRKISPFITEKIVDWT